MGEMKLQELNEDVKPQNFDDYFDEDQLTADGYSREFVEEIYDIARRNKGPILSGDEILARYGIG